ncbi:hypothetical protein D9611_013516 [Ephemerocybe angulata]|uniref:DNA 3'-5' helicase n=1 Tax=Ephemerocybe angulata TaxID=980116 RepID=A0A8H5BSW1_9AGAR|nr:hypothetical protein D9611_013516 [Tulosesus angulatus]
MCASFSAWDYAGDDEMEAILRFTARVAQFSSTANNRPTRDTETEPGPQQYNGSQESPVPMGKRINYHTDSFDWDRALLAKSKATFDIPEFRLCQRGVCNANMDGRDIICVMPSGEGTSLMYQLPALLIPGVTVVISPFIDRVEEQVMALMSRNVETVMLLGTMESEARNQINERLLEMSSVAGANEIKICYVTPTTIVQDNDFLAVLYNLHSKGKVARIVLDKADCVSSDSHDFRPDYRKLHILKNSLPNVPIMALSTTCARQVLEDITKVLKLPPIVPGENANTEGTVYFAPPGVFSTKKDIDEGGSSDSYEDTAMEVGAAGYWQMDDEDFEQFLAEPRPSA